MRITLNGAEVETEAPTLAALLIERDMADLPAATALNETFVPKAARAATPLAPGDRVEVVTPRQGG